VRIGKVPIDPRPPAVDGERRGEGQLGPPQLRREGGGQHRREAVERRHPRHDEVDGLLGVESARRGGEHASGRKGVRSRDRLVRDPNRPVGSELKGLANRRDRVGPPDGDGDDLAPVLLDEADGGLDRVLVQIVHSVVRAPGHAAVSERALQLEIGHVLHAHEDSHWPTVYKRGNGGSSLAVHETPTEPQRGRKMDALSHAQALFTRQVDAYVAAGYDERADLTESEFRRLLEPLRAVLDRAVAEGLGLELSPARLPFVVVVTSRLVPPGDRVAQLRVAGSDKEGTIDPGHRDGLAAYLPIPDLLLPDADAYLLVDVDRGDTLREIAANDAVSALAASGRSPLALDEGLSLAAVHPLALEPDAGFLLAGSRNRRRVPALWVTAGGATLGWGGGATPETWLGVASAAARVAA